MQYEPASRGHRRRFLRRMRQRRQIQRQPQISPARRGRGGSGAAPPPWTAHRAGDGQYTLISTEQMEQARPPRGASPAPHPLAQHQVEQAPGQPQGQPRMTLSKDGNPGPDGRADVSPSRGEGARFGGCPGTFSAMSACLMTVSYLSVHPAQGQGGVKPTWCG